MLPLSQEKQRCRSPELTRTTGVWLDREHGLHRRRGFRDVEFQRHGHGRRQLGKVQDGVAEGT